MDRTILIAGVAASVVGAGILAVMALSGDDDLPPLPFGPCADCAPSHALASAGLFEIEEGPAFLAVRFRDDIQARPFVANFFVDANRNGAYDREEGEERLVRDVRVQAAPGSVHLFPVPSFEVRGALATTFTISDGDLDEDGPQAIVSMSDLLFGDDLQPVSGVFGLFEAIERETNASSGGMSAVDIPAVCIGPDGSHIACPPDGDVGQAPTAPFSFEFNGLEDLIELLEQDSPYWVFDGWETFLEEIAPSGPESGTQPRPPTPREEELLDSMDNEIRRAIDEEALRGWPPFGPSLSGPEWQFLTEPEQAPPESEELPPSVLEYLNEAIVPS